MGRREGKWCPPPLSWNSFYILKIFLIFSLQSSHLATWGFICLAHFVKVFGSYMPLIKPSLWKFGFHCQILINIVCNANSFTFKVKVKSNMVNVFVDMREKCSVMFYSIFFVRFTHICWLSKGFSSNIFELLFDPIHDVTSCLRYEWYKKHVIFSILLTIN